jgi:hypothetical protein
MRTLDTAPLDSETCKLKDKLLVALHVTHNGDTEDKSR